MPNLSQERLDDIKELAKLMRIDESNTIVLAVCSTPTFQQKLIDKIQNELVKEGIFIHQFALPSDQINLAQGLQELIESPGFQQLEKSFNKVAISTGGLDKFDSRRADFVELLNLNRNHFADFGHTLIIWVNQLMAEAISRNAPDFYSWISRVFTFDEKTEMQQNVNITDSSGVNIIQAKGDVYHAVSHEAEVSIKTGDISGDNVVIAGRDVRKFKEGDVTLNVSIEREGMRRPDLIPAPGEPQNLPPKAFFVGRKGYIDEVMSGLDFEERTWIVSIDGVGGVGKTALALEIGHRCWDEKRFEAVVWTAAKETYLTADGIKKEKPRLTCLDDLLNEIAQVFDASQIIKLKQDEKRQEVYDLLKTKKTLLIIDNLETLSDEESLLLSQFLNRTPNTCKTIVTSRRRLGEGERVVRLKGMEREEAVQLLSHECRIKGVAISEEQQMKIYERTGGIPLAMVWVIGQMSVKELSPERVIERLAQAPGSPILEFCFRDSLKLLNRDADRLFRLMAVFAAPVDMEVLKATSGISDQLDLEDALARLLKLSLVNKEDDSCYLLPLTKTFGIAELAKDPIFEKDARLKVAQYYLEYSLKNGGFQNWEGFKRLNKEFANILSSFNWCYESSQWQMVVKFYNDGLGNFLFEYGYWDEAIELGKKCLESAKKLEDKKEYAQCAIYSLGWIYSPTCRNEIDEAKKILAEGLRIAEGLDNKWNIATAKHYLGLVAQEEGDYPQTEALYQEALGIAKGFGAEGNVSALLTELGKLAYTQGNYTKAKDYHQKSLEISQRLKNEVRIAISLSSLGKVAIKENDYEKARKYLHDALKIVQELGGIDEIAKAKWRLGLVEEGLENYPQARSFFEEALEIYRRLRAKKKIEEVEEAIKRVEKE